MTHVVERVVAVDDLELLIDQDPLDPGCVEAPVLLEADRLGRRGMGPRGWVLDPDEDVGEPALGIDQRVLGQYGLTLVHRGAFGVGRHLERVALGRGSFELRRAVDARRPPRRGGGESAGQRHDSPQAGRLIENFEPQALIADKGYDSDTLIESVTAKGSR